ncbi:hypothetical protein [Yersinia proxima]|uniref:hypothetical protein n=1 Tax=Yersinia proxima TaxID=2890316 RepID=UPI003D696115
MAVATILASSDKRSDYPLRVVAFDMLALELMLCPFGLPISVTGSQGYYKGYQLIAKKVDFLT